MSAPPEVTGLDRYGKRFRGVRLGHLLGLEFLIASDISGTVAVGPTYRDLGVWPCWC